MLLRFNRPCNGTRLLPLVVLLLMQLGCQTKSPQQDELQITTKSDEAREIFIQARESAEKMRYIEAYELYSKAIETDPDFALAYTFRSFVSPSTADRQADLKKAVELSGKATEGERLLIEAASEWYEGNRVNAIEKYKQLAEKFPKDKRAQFMLGAVYYLERQYENAIPMLNKAIEIDSNYASPYNLVGYAYTETNKYQNAEEAYKNYIRLIPNEANPYDSMGDLYLKIGKLQEAADHFIKAFELNSNFVFSQQKHGFTLVLMGKYDEGRDAIKKSIDMSKDATSKIDGMDYLGYTALIEGKSDEANLRFDEAIKYAMEKNLPDLAAWDFMMKGVIYVENLGKFDDAAKCFGECRKLFEDPRVPSSTRRSLEKWTLFHETWLAAKKKDDQTITSKLEEFKTKIDPAQYPVDDEIHQELLGLISFEKGDFQAAIEHFNQSKRNESMLWYLHGVAEAKLGNTARSQELYQKAANWNDPSFEYALTRPKALTALTQIAKK